MTQAIKIETADIIGGVFFSESEADGTSAWKTKLQIGKFKKGVLSNELKWKVRGHPGELQGTNEPTNTIRR